MYGFTLKVAVKGLGDLYVLTTQILNKMTDFHIYIIMSTF